MTITTYSFLDVSATLSGPGGIIEMGAGSGAAKEGITLSYVEDANKMDIGADGSAMHSLRASKGATASVRLLKTSPINKQLMAMFNFQRASAATHGQNVLTVRNSASQDLHIGIQAAFKKAPDNAYSEDGNMLEWRFDIGRLESLLG